MNGILGAAMSTMFWDVATSDLALTITAIVMVAAFVVSHMPVVRDLPAVKPYAIAAGIVAYLALAWLSLCVGYRISDDHAETARLKTELAWNANQLKQQKATADDAERIAQEKAAEAEELKGKVSDYEKALEAAAAANPQSACALSDDDVARLRALSKRARKH